MEQKTQYGMDPVGGNAAVVMAPRPAAPPGCPPGLEYLTQVDQLLIHQQVDVLELFTGWEVANKYVINNSMGQQVYFAGEESEVCQRQCCKEARGFTMHISDNNKQEVLRIIREFKCCAGCCWCANGGHCSFTVDIESPVGTKIGSVVQSQTYWKPKYTVRDASDQTIFVIDGPCCICQTVCCRDDVDFIISSADKSAQIGTIAKQWAGCCKETWTRANNFGVTFPMDLDVKMKGCLLGAVFLIDFMYFEHSDDGGGGS